MGERLSLGKAHEQYLLIYELKKQKGASSFKSNVQFDIDGKEDVFLNDVDIVLFEGNTADGAYFTINIEWDEKSITKAQEQLLKSVYSKTASTNFQTIKEDSFKLVIENDNVTIYLDLL